MSYHGFKKKYKVYIRQYTGSKSHRVGTQITFSGKDAARCYNLIKTQKLDLGILMMDQHTLSLGRIDLYFSRTNGETHLELKGPVGSEIKEAAGLGLSVTKQGKKSALKLRIN